MRVKRRTLRTVLIVMLCLAVVGGGVLLVVNSYVKDVGEGRLLSVAQAAELDGVDCILVLGCQVRDDGSLSHMLRDRLSRALELYEMGAAPKMLMSGDHGRKEYDEVGAMKQHAVEHGVPSENVFMDHAGFSTYETVYRAKEIFKVDKVIIVTQEYHLYRALYIADRIGIDAYGVPSTTTHTPVSPDGNFGRFLQGVRILSYASSSWSRPTWEKSFRSAVTGI